MHHVPLFNATAVEIFFSGLQSLSAVLILVYSFSLVLPSVAPGPPPQLVNLGDGQCLLGPLCLPPAMAIVAIRLVKELCNVACPLLEVRVLVRPVYHAVCGIPEAAAA